MNSPFSFFLPDVPRPVQYGDAMVRMDIGPRQMSLLYRDKWAELRKLVESVKAELVSIGADPVGLQFFNGKKPGHYVLLGYGKPSPKPTAHTPKPKRRKR